MALSGSAVPPVSPDRFITTFTTAYHTGATPYQNVNFHPKVKAACCENRTRRVGIKIAKAIIVGDVSVGKTCLVNRFCHKIFDREYKATIGVDFEMEKFCVLSVPITLQIWDTAGQERFKCIATAYYRGAQIVIVAFDLTDEETLQHTEQWMKEACVSADDPIKFLVGTKKDLLSPEDYRNIEEKAVKYANKLEAEFWPTSSKTEESVKEFFFRAMCLSFDDMVVKELEFYQPSSKQIGSDLVRVNRSQSDLHDKKQKKIPCC